MTYLEFLDAVTPYNYQKPKDKTNFYEANKTSIEQVMRIVDCEGKGSISFNEFAFLVIVNQLPTEYIAD